MLHQALGHDRRHHLASVVRTLAPAVAQREGERVGEVFGAGGREAVGVWHGAHGSPGSGTVSKKRRPLQWLGEASGLRWMALARKDGSVTEALPEPPSREPDQVASKPGRYQSILKAAAAW